MFEALSAALIGGAGTGKTRRLMDTLGLILDRIEDPLKVGYVSFTRAARREAVQRAAERFDIHPHKLQTAGWFRTLHSVCLRILGLKDQLLTNDAKSRKWVADALGQPIADLDGDPAEGFSQAKTDAQLALQIWGTARSSMKSVQSVWDDARASRTQMVPMRQVRWYIQLYEEKKKKAELVDYTDILALIAGFRFGLKGIEKVKPVGYLPRLTAWIFDEQQDTSALLDAVCRRLIATPSVVWWYCAGDPFQSIFGFAGADHRYFLDLKPDKTEIMRKSWRCPENILGLGERVLQPCKDYFDREIQPADHDGEISRCRADEIPSLLDAREDWLMLTRTNRHGYAISRELDKRGIPWRPTKGKGWWTSSKRTRAIRTLYKMQQGHTITAVEWRDVCAELPAKGRLTWGSKSYWTEKLPIQELRKFKPTAPDEWYALGVEPAYEDKIRSGGWMEDIDHAADYITALNRYGEDLCDEPKIRLGTIHSAKGAEADSVCLLTSSAYPIFRSMSYRHLRDAEQRVWYVGVTRARRRLVVAKDPDAKHKKGLPI